MAVQRDELLSDVKVADVDTHIIEPHDLWTSPMPATRWGDEIPRAFERKGI